MPRPLPETETLVLVRRGPRLDVTLNRPERRNAMSALMNRELREVFDAIADDAQARIVVLRGAGGWFCAGGDMKERDKSLEEPADPREAARERNRFGGQLFAKINNAPQAVIAVVEGAAVGGGFGMACTADITIAHREAVFGMPETSLGVPPAQIAPYVVRRLGLSQARRLAVTGARFKGEEALALGLAHFVGDDAEALDARVEECVRLIARGGPRAIAATKAVMNAALHLEEEEMIAFAADRFAECVVSDEGREGTRAFVEKRKPTWAAGAEA